MEDLERRPSKSMKAWYHENVPRGSMKKDFNEGSIVPLRRRGWGVAATEEKNWGV